VSGPEGSVLFIGDVNLDILLSGLESPVRPDREVFCGGYGRALGGSTALAAAAYARLGGKSAFCGLVGDDEDGRFAASRLRAAGVDLSMLRSSADAPTGVTVNLAFGHERSQVTCRGTLALMDESRAALDSLPAFAHLHVSGPYGMPKFLPRVANLLSASKSAGKTLSLDTQWDPSERWEGLREWLPSLDLLFVNEHEAASITGKPDPEDAWSALSELTPCPIVKLGAAGAFAAGRRFPGIEVDVADTTGAGDTFAAGFLFARLSLGADLGGSARFAVAAGAVACTWPGGDDDRLTRGAVEGLLA